MVYKILRATWGWRNLPSSALHENPSSHRRIVHPYHIASSTLLLLIGGNGKNLIPNFAMRPLLGILLASIASLSYSASLEAPVYIFDPSGRPSRSDLSITPETARLIFAQRLGVTQYHSLKHEDEEILRILNKYGSREGKLFCDEDGSHDRHGKLLVVVESVEHPEGSSLRHTFRI